MKIIYQEDYYSISKLAEDIIAREVEIKNDLLFCAATGQSPTGMYAEMAKHKSIYSKLRVVKLDEWGIIPSTNPESCETYLKKHFLEPLEISKERYFGFETTADMVDSECARMRDFMEEEGPVDICILGLGKNGHIAFNEPNEFLEPEFHKALLAPITTENLAAMSQGNEAPFGLCMGMKDILNARLVILLVTGNGKQQATQEFLSGKISTKCPASFLWLHPNTVCFIDKRVLKN